MKLKDGMFALYEHYLNASHQFPSSSSSTSSNKAKMPSMNEEVAQSSTFKDILMEFDSFESVETTPRKTQLVLYLEDPRIDRKTKLNALTFWQANQYRYPQVAAIARHVLSIPISTVLDQYRSSVKPDIIEALICTRDWLYGDQELQLQTRSLKNSQTTSWISISMAKMKRKRIFHHQIPSKHDFYFIVLKRLV
ncbi:zinc finger BED domain-containing protein RICESLEEPER 1-like [Dioscorea cayenensis subsp. rotundata]|uniref:Zinc finger BED domain-containing protein RICESLEEPER 1-like n=1 Tax=Dioscorea cayennensis subsp. rotundata TaxID=55577 RepID=A0AB40AXQ4_DIOCR|nr:zinc finger BED domain-containing protein RICESLEEPER 1-like [Dioscorea cayenensis subsp. rotundata]